MSEGAESTIAVRRPTFPEASAFDLEPARHDPEASCELLALSFTLPYLEPYLIRTMRSAAKVVDDPMLRADMRAFSGQEAQHHQQHARTNDHLRSLLSPSVAAAVRRVEDALDADYRRFSTTRSIRFNLAYAEGFEAMTFALARSILDSSETEATSEAWRQLILWHLAEEVEHRTVTFDAFDHVDGSWAYRTAVGTWSQLHFLRHVLDLTVALRADLVPARATRRQSAWYTIRRQVRLGTAGGVLRALSPRYDPRRVALSDRVVALAATQGVDLR